ncbi:MAG: YhdT family protein [Zestosphaera sp.]
MTNDPRFQIAKREAIILLALFVAYIVWWYAFAYGLGSRDPTQYSYILGFPDWFFYSCVLSIPVFSLLLFIIIKVFFKEVPLD